jgi:hypothetical protein
MIRGNTYSNIGLGGVSSHWTPRYYVSNTGDDSKDGLSPLNAWRTIAKVNSMTFVAGDNIAFAKDGVWKDAALLVPSGGSAGRPITFGNYGSGSLLPVINGADILSSWTSESVTAGAATERETQTVTNTSSNPFKSADRKYIATEVVATSSYSLTEIKVNLTKVLSPTMDINCYLYSDTASNPTSLLATSSTTLNAASITNGADHAFAFDGSFTVVSGTKYWIVLKGSAVDTNNYVSWNAASSGGSLMIDADGVGTWTLAISWHLSFRMKGTPVPFTAYYATETVHPKFIFDGTVYYQEAASKTTLTAGTYWWDSGNNRVYIRTTGDNIPTGYTIEVPVRGGGADAALGLVDFNGKSYITFNGIEVKNSNGTGIKNYASTDGQTYQWVKNCTASYCAAGGIVLATDTKPFSYPRIDTCIAHHCNLSDAPIYESIAIMYGTDFVIKNCVVHHHYHEGIDAHGGSPGNPSLRGVICGNTVYGYIGYSSLPGIYLDGVNGVEVYNNKVYGQKSATNPSCQAFFINSEISGNNNSNVNAHNNVFYDCNVGFMMKVQTGSTDHANIKFDNNTIAKMTGRSVYFDATMLNNISGSNYMRDNIFWGAGTSDILDDATGKATIAAFTIDHNLFLTGKASDTQGTNPVLTSDPLFTDYANNVYTLQANSPTIGAGIDVGYGLNIGAL